MIKRGKLQKAERLEISILLKRGFSQRDISRALARSPNTISYEVGHNSVRGVYDPEKAQAKARVRLKYRRFQWRKIEQHKGLRRYIVTKLKAGWNPDEIAGRSKDEGKPFYASKSAIYDWLRTVQGQRYCRYLYSQRYYLKKRRGKVKRVLIPHRIGIEQRWLGATNRTRYGHWEADSVVSGKNGRGALAVLQERKSRLLMAAKTQSMSPREHSMVQKRILTNMRVRSITFDNGLENRYHERIGIPTFFCDPYSSWQKGSIENANKLLRRYMPKGTNMCRVSPAYLRRIVERINNKPRKILGYKTAYEVAIKAGLFLTPTPVS